LNTLRELAKLNSEWLKIVRSFGSKEPEDIVQELYIKCYNVEKTKIFINGEINRAYIWVTLRNIYYTKCKEKPLVYEEAEEVEYLYHEKKEVLLTKIENEINNWHDFDRMLFKFYMSKDKSMREIANGSKIPLRSIFETIKTCKERIRQNVGEDYQDFKNKDYELIL
jgi:predicted DNA-binding protein YlxM (UPF0122 family)